LSASANTAAFKPGYRSEGQNRAKPGFFQPKAKIQNRELVSVMPQVIVCAENAVTRAGLAAMVAATAVEVVGQVSTVSQLKDWLRNQSVDLVLLAPSELTGTVAHEVVQIVTEWIFEPSLAVLLFVELWDAVSLIDPPLAKEPVQQQRLLAPLLATGSVSMMPLTVSTAQVQGAIAAILRGFVVLHPEVVELIAAHSVNWTAEPDLDSDPPL
jgi:DNA-binding NarL/FixJ family response regulator